MKRPVCGGLSGETHSFVCRRCKAAAESLRQKDRDAELIVFMRGSPYGDCYFCIREIERGN